MGLNDLLKSLDDKFMVNEESKTYTVGYEMDGNDKSYNVKASTDSEARQKFKDYMEANGKDSSEYRIVGVYESSMDMEEANMTSNLDGGQGQPKVPHAFQRDNPTSSDKKKERDNATSSTGYDIAKKTNRYIKKRNEIFDKASALIDRVDERRYTEFARDDTMSDKRKINYSIKEIYSKLFEIEKTLNHAMKLKRETGMEDVFWETTKKRFKRMSDRMLRVSTKLREFNK